MTTKQVMIYNKIGAPLRAHLRKDGTIYIPGISKKLIERFFANYK